jgi:CBS domain-containing protein
MADSEGRALQCKKGGESSKGGSMLARDVMSSGVVTVEAKASLLDAVKLLINSGVSALPVIDEKGAFVGVLSEFDVIRHVMGGEGEAALQSQLERGGALSEVYARALAGPVASLMTSPAISAQEGTPLKDIADMMLKHQIKRVPIVRDGTVVGVVSRVDLVKALLSRPPVAGDAATSPQSMPEADDDQLRQDVITAIRRLGLPLSGGFDVVARHGSIHLWGQTPDEEHHQAYRAAAAKVGGVREVHTHMQVMPLRGPSAWRW